jgi:hypothetical protein
MEAFLELYARMIVFVYHCFDRIVINGYLSMLSRPENVVYFFREVVGIKAITKEVLSRRTRDYQRWVEAYALTHDIPMQWAEKGVRKEDFVLPYLRGMERAKRYGVYFILQSMEQGHTFRSRKPKFPTSDPDYHILAKSRTRFTHYYFYIRDEVLGPMVIRVASFLPFQTTYYLNGHNFIEAELRRAQIRFRKNDNAFVCVADPQALQAAADRFSPEIIRRRLDYWSFVLGPKFTRRERAAMNLGRFYAICQVEYCRNFIFRKHFPIHKIFERSCELGLLSLSADKISEIFGRRVTRRLRGKLHTTLEHLEHGHHVLRAYLKNSFLRQYEKLQTFLRNELCCNNLKDFSLKKGLDNLPLVRESFQNITDRFAAFQAQALNVHVEFPLFQRIALPVVIGRTKIPGIKVHQTRLIRLMELMIHSGASISTWRTNELHQRIVETYALNPQCYTLTQLRYDLRKMKAHGLIERHGRHYAYRLTPKGIKVSLLFLLFHKRVCGPLANSLFHHRPDPKAQPPSTLETAYHQADESIEKIISLLAA